MAQTITERTDSGWPLLKKFLGGPLSVAFGRLRLDLRRAAVAHPARRLRSVLPGEEVLVDLLDELLHRGDDGLVLVFLRGGLELRVRVGLLGLELGLLFSLVAHEAGRLRDIAL